MFFFIQKLLCIICIGIIGYETYIILKRNKTVIVKGKDDFFTITIVMFFIILFMPLDQSTSVLSAMRNTLIIIAVFATIAIRRGISERGIEKIFYYIPWETIERVHIDSYQSTKVMVYFEQKSKKTATLIFHYRYLSKLIFNLQKYMRRDEILLEPIVEQNMKKFSKI